MLPAELLRKACNRTYPGFDKETEKSWNGSFYFIQGADTQFGMADTFEDIPKNSWDTEVQLTLKAISLINSMTPKPQFFIVCGDLVDAMPGTKYREDQEKDVIKVFNQLRSDVPLICVCGNHDLGDRPSPYSVQAYKDKFGDDYFTFYCGGVMFIVLNSQFFQDPTQVEDLAAEQEKWLDDQLNEAKSGKYKHVVIFQHIPWFLRDPEEDKEYFNILPELRERMLKKFYDANVRVIFCGHYHRNSGGFYKDMELVVTSAIGYQLGEDKSGFRIVKVEENHVKHEYLSFEDAPNPLIMIEDTV